MKDLTNDNTLRQTVTEARHSIGWALLNDLMEQHECEMQDKQDEAAWRSLVYVVSSVIEYSRKT